MNCEEAKTKKIELIIRKLSNDTVFKVSKPLYETVTKQRMLMIISRLFSEQEVRIQYRSTLNLQWSYGDRLKLSPIGQGKVERQNMVYKWKMLTYRDGFEIVGTSLRSM